MFTIKIEVQHEQPKNLTTHLFQSDGLVIYESETGFMLTNKDGGVIFDHTNPQEASSATPDRELSVYITDKAGNTVRIIRAGHDRCWSPETQGISCAETVLGAAN